MTPQELMDLKGYGSAEKVLRRAGKWRLMPLELMYEIPDTECTAKVNAKIDAVIALLEEKNQ